MIDIISTLIFVEDEEIVSDCWYAFKHLTDIEESEPDLEKIKLEILSEVEVIGKIVSIIKIGKMWFTPALRVLGNLSASNNTAWDNQILKAGFFQKGTFTLYSKSELILEYSGWVIDRRED